MAGTILKQLLSTHQTDNTAMTAGNSGFSSGSAGTSNTAIHLDAAKMAGAEGYRLTQASANQNNWYLDLTSAVTILAWRIPFNYATAATTSCTILRGYPDATHAATMWSLALTTGNRLNFVEAGTGGLNLTSTGTALTPGTDYVMLGLVDTASMALAIDVYPRASTTKTFGMTGTLVTSTAQQAVRWGIGTGSSLATLDTNDNFAIGNGSGGQLLRADVTNPALSITAAMSPTTGPNPTVVNLTITPSGGNGNAISYSVDWGDTTTSGPQSGTTFSHTYARPVGVTTWTATATQAN